MPVIRRSLCRRRICKLFAIILLAGVGVSSRTQETDSPGTRVTIVSDGWELAGDLVLPSATARVAAALLLHRANGSRSEYEDLAAELAQRNIASLRIDLRGHGDSTNLGRFVAGEQPPSPLIRDAERDVMAAIAYLSSLESIDPGRIAVVGGSYSGEEMAEAGRLTAYAAAYVALSPGSFSDDSIAGIDDSGVPWLFVTSRDETYLQEIRAQVTASSRTVEQIIVPGDGHATRLLAEFPGLSERIAVWLAARL